MPEGPIAIDDARRQHDSPLLFEQVARAVRELISARTLVAGDRAPSLRASARHLGVSVATVVRAYEELEREGRLEARLRSGYYIATPTAVATPARPRAAGRVPAARPVRAGEHVDEIIESARLPGVVPFAVANPGTDLLPSKALGRALRAVAAGSPASLIDYAPMAGEPALQQEIAAHASRLGAPVDPGDVVVTAGATEALALALRVVTRPGDTVVVESPVYFGLLRLLESHALRAIELPTDPINGLEPESLERVLARTSVAAVVSIATFNNPTGSLVPTAARERIVALCARHRTTLIEDDLYADLHAGERRPRSYRDVGDATWVVTCSSFSKTVAPGFRIGWVISSRHRVGLVERKIVASGSNARLPQLAMARFLGDGQYGRHVARLRRAYREQLRCLRASVHRHLPDGTRTSDPAGGFVLWVSLAGSVDTQALYRRAIADDISFAPGALFTNGRGFRNCLRLSAGEPWTERHDVAIAHLAALAAER